MSFKGRTALVTGGSRGIGRAVVEQLLAQDAQVHVWSLDAERQKGVAALGATVSVVDVRDQDAVHLAAVELLQDVGRLDILVNNAGVFGPMKSMMLYSLVEWNAVFDANLTSQFLVCRAFVPNMLMNGYGRIVNLASVVGRDANPMAPAYSAAKAGVIRFTQALGRELAQTGVLVNCVAPSATNTDLFRDAPQAQMDIMKAKVPLGRFAEPQEVAQVVCWLASDRMTYSTGAVFDCSGGRHE